MTALAGLKVVDLSKVAAGPFATMILADMGAEVVKVERPLHGDDARHMDVTTGQEKSGYFLGLNKGKRSIALDLKEPEDLDAVLRLARDADVFVENFRPGACDEMGLSYERLSEISPRLVYCSISGYGPHGPNRGKLAYDIVAQAAGGLMDITGEEDGAPSKAGPPVADMVAGVFAVVGILAALHERELSGRGQHVQGSLVGSVVSLLAPYITARSIGTEFRRLGSAHNTLAPYQAFAGGDGRYFIVAVAKDVFFSRLMAILDRPDLVHDPRFATNAARTARRAELAAILQARFGERSASEWIAELEAAGVPASPISTIDEVIDDRSNQENGYVRFVDHPVRGTLAVVATPLSFSRTPVRTSAPPPLLDEHGTDIREELANSGTTT